MTPMERQTLLALAHGPLTFEQARKACRATMRGHRIVRNRLFDAGLIERMPYDGTPRIGITEAGLAAVSLDEPCSICGGEILLGDGKDRGGDVTHDVCLEDAGELH